MNRSRIAAASWRIFSGRFPCAVRNRHDRVAKKAMTRPTDPPPPSDLTSDLPDPPGSPQPLPAWDFGSVSVAPKSTKIFWTDEDFARISGWVRGQSEPTPERTKADFSTGRETTSPKADEKRAFAEGLRRSFSAMWRATRQAIDGARRELAAARSRSQSLRRSIGALVLAAIGALSDAMLGARRRAGIRRRRVVEAIASLSPLASRHVERVRRAAAGAPARRLLRSGARSARLFTMGLVDAFHVDMRPVLRSATVRVSTAVLLMGVGYGLAEAMRSAADGLVSDSAPPSRPVAIAAVAETVGTVPLPMPRIAHVPERTRAHGDVPERKVASRFGADAALAMARPLAGWQPMGGEQARARTLNAPARIYEVQVRLLRLGYPAGRPTSTLTAGTKRAIVLFQRDMRLPMTGDIDARLVRRLRVADESTLHLARR